MSGRQTKILELVKIIGIPHGPVVVILHEKLSHKILTRYVLRFLTVKNELNRVVYSVAVWRFISINPDEFPRRYVTGDETRIHRYTIGENNS